MLSARANLRIPSSMFIRAFRGWKAMTKSWLRPAIPLVAIAIVLVVGPKFLPHGRGFTFLGVLVLLAAEFAVIGWAINDRPIGAFIDNRNRLSLSKLQAGAWTAVVLAGLATAAAYNALVPGTNYSSLTALNVVIPGELLLAMGISATSLVATPSLLSLKASETPLASSVTTAQAKLPGSSNNGKLTTRSSAADASWSDLVTGDEVGNAGSPDLGKIQQALITLLLLGCYTGYVYEMFVHTSGPIGTLPVIDKSFVWLMGISHASYLAYKAAPHTQTESPS
ncbi:MAG: hypothetical protein E8A12_13885 [Phenylobacterium sp.]|nr:MAG: hypothetical protein E8A12_13885 [Phenylobacterium sp.]